MHRVVILKYSPLTLRLSKTKDPFMNKDICLTLLWPRSDICGRNDPGAELNGHSISVPSGASEWITPSQKWSKQPEEWTRSRTNQDGKFSPNKAFRPDFPLFVVVPWWLWATCQLCLFGCAHGKHFEAATGLLQRAHLTRIYVVLPFQDTGFLTGHIKISEFFKCFQN